MDCPRLQPVRNLAEGLKKRREAGGFPGLTFTTWAVLRPVTSGPLDRSRSGSTPAPSTWYLTHPLRSIRHDRSTPSL